MLQDFNPQSHVLVRQQKQCVIKSELHTAQNPHCSSRPEPRQVAANSFTQSIQSSALNSALQTHTTAFITCLAAIYSFTIQPLLKKASVTSSNTKYATFGNSLYRRLKNICLHCRDCKNKDQDDLESRLGCHKERLQVINIAFEYKQASHTVVSKSKTIFKCTQ